MNTIRLGNLLAALSFIFWGVTPLYYQFLPHASTEELLAVRIIASVPLMALLVLLLRGKLPDIKAILKRQSFIQICFFR